MKNSHSTRTRSIRTRGIKQTVLLYAALACALTLAGCGLQPATAFVPAVAPGSIQEIKDLPDNASITITSKNYTEALILGKMAVLATQAAGFNVTDKSNVPGSVAVRELMLNGGADLVWDYTGTAWLTYLGHKEGIPDPAEQYAAVLDEDMGNGLTWLDPADLNNTYAMAVRSDAVEELGGITKLSQIKDLPVNERTFCVESEFNSRPDGFKPMLKTYGLELGSPDGVPDGNVKILDTGTVYEATARGECNFGEVFTTDGRILSLNLSVLEDDQGFFPAYNVAPVVRTEVLEEFPALRPIFKQISSRLTNDEQQKLNLKVDVDGQEPADVAFQWMVDEGLITAP